jgi:predicted metal-dependent phosphotriesterase family hydrolase
VLRRGVYGGFDQAGHMKYGPDEARAGVIVELWRRGFGRQIALSSDLGRRSYWLSNGGWPGLSYVLSQYLPLLIRLGLDRMEAWSMVRENPQRALIDEG